VSRDDDFLSPTQRYCLLAPPALINVRVDARARAAFVAAFSNAAASREGHYFTSALIREIHLFT
jgi:hypothetical protein